MNEVFIIKFRTQKIILKFANTLAVLLFIVPFILGSYQNYQLWIIVALFIILLFIIKHKLTRCPCCRKHISEDQWRYSVHPPNSCPHCGVVLLPLPDKSESKMPRIMMSAGFLPLGIIICLTAYYSGLKTLYLIGAGLIILSAFLILLIRRENSNIDQS